eukprot:PhF_6_TR19010/c0_g1_i1/m.27867
MAISRDAKRGKLYKKEEQRNAAKALHEKVETTDHLVLWSVNPFKDLPSSPLITRASVTNNNNSEPIRKATATRDDKKQKPQAVLPSAPPPPLPSLSLPQGDAFSIVGFRECIQYLNNGLQTSTTTAKTESLTTWRITSKSWAVILLYPLPASSTTASSSVPDLCGLDCIYWAIPDLLLHSYLVPKSHIHVLLLDSPRSISTFMNNTAGQGNTVPSDHNSGGRNEIGAVDLSMVCFRKRDRWDEFLRTYQRHAGTT